MTARFFEVPRFIGLEADAVGDAGTRGEEYFEPAEGAKVYVGNLSYDVDSEKLAHLFEQAGVVEVSKALVTAEKRQTFCRCCHCRSTQDERELKRPRISNPIGNLLAYSDCSNRSYAECDELAQLAEILTEENTS